MKMVRLIGKWIYANGVKYAGMASIRTTYETPVPEKLKEKVSKNSTKAK